MSDMPRYTIDGLKRDAGVFAWGAQALQYPQRGEPHEIVYRRYDDNSAPGQWIDALLYYDERGLLAGILNHYPFEMQDMDGLRMQDEHSTNLFIRPDIDMKDPANRLAEAAVKRWGDDLKGDVPIRWGELQPRPHYVPLDSFEGQHRLGHG